SHASARTHTGPLPFPSFLNATMLPPLDPIRRSASPSPSRSPAAGAARLPTSYGGSHASRRLHTGDAAVPTFAYATTTPPPCPTSASRSPSPSRSTRTGNAFAPTSGRSAHSARAHPASPIV